MLIHGSITIDFVTKSTKRNLLENFNDYLVKMGTVNLTNMNDDHLELKIHNHEITHLERESV